MEHIELAKSDIEKVRGVDGFPNGSYESIRSLSNAPSYAACPNPFIGDFVKGASEPYQEDADKYKREPFAADVSEGKKDPVYNAHSYHTKVPYKAIMRYLVHYTKPGDIVFDGFCGTGMTCVAAQMCGSEDHSLEFEMTGEFESSKWGKRYAVISDLSPAATFIADVYNTPVNLNAFEDAFKRISKKAEDECGWMYETANGDGKKCHVNYTVFSDVFICPHCGREIIFWDSAVDKETGSVKTKFSCTHCKAEISKKDAEKAVSAVLGAVEDALVNGEKVQLIGFGTFEVKERAARVGHNPRTGEAVEIAASKIPSFKAGAALKNAVK